MNKEQTAALTATQQAAQTGCNYCSSPMYAGVKCKNCGRESEQAAPSQGAGLNQYGEPIEEWTTYAKRSGLLDSDGIATDRSKAQTAWNAFSFAWNRSWEVNKAALLEASTQREQQWVCLTDAEIEKGRDQTFSINNPFCPCDSKTMRKAVRWAEAKLRENNSAQREQPGASKPEPQAQAGEPEVVEWQSRWTIVPSDVFGAHSWTRWESCDPHFAKAYLKTPIYKEKRHEVRPLITLQSHREAMQDQTIGYEKTIYKLQEAIAKKDAALKADNSSRFMLVARLEAMSSNGAKWLTVEAVLALLNDCDMLANLEADAAISQGKEVLS